MAFRLGHDDAKVIGKDLGLADPTELQRLKRFEVMLQLVTDEGLSTATTGETIRPGPTTGQAAYIRQRQLQAPVQPVLELPVVNELQPVGIEP